jgi:hypothetical protein
MKNALIVILVLLTGMILAGCGDCNDRDGCTGAVIEVEAPEPPAPEPPGDDDDEPSDDLSTDDKSSDDDSSSEDR